MKYVRRGESILRIFKILMKKTGLRLMYLILMVLEGVVIWGESQ